MVAARLTGIEAVDRELKRRKFSSAEDAEMTANQLLAVYRMLTSSSHATYPITLRAQRRKQVDRE
jgi:hypothetical protein